MVTTNSLETLHVTYFSLQQSEYVEDKELAAQMRYLLETLVEKIKPIMKYVDGPIGREGQQIRAIEVVAKDSKTITSALYLDRNGVWHHGSDPQNLITSSVGWSEYPFSTVLTGLENAFTIAEEKKREHLKLVSDRRELLSKMLKSINEY